MISRENALKSLNEIIEKIQTIPLFKATSTGITELEQKLSDMKQQGASAFAQMLHGKKLEKQVSETTKALIKKQRDLKAIKNIFNFNALLQLQEDIANESIGLYDSILIDIKEIQQNTASLAELSLTDKSNLDVLKEYKELVKEAINLINDNLQIQKNDETLSMTPSHSTSSSHQYSTSSMSPDSGFDIFSPSQSALVSIASASSSRRESKASLTRNAIMTALTLVSAKINEVIEKHKQDLIILKAEKTALLKQIDNLSLNSKKMANEDKLQELQLKIKTIEKTEMSNLQMLFQMEQDDKLMISLKASLATLPLENDTFEENLQNMQELLTEFKKTRMRDDKQEFSVKLQQIIIDIENETRYQKQVLASDATSDMTPAPTGILNTAALNKFIKPTGAHSGKFTKPAVSSSSASPAAVAIASQADMRSDPFAHITTAVPAEDLLNLSAFMNNSPPSAESPAVATASSANSEIEVKVSAEETSPKAGPVPVDELTSTETISLVSPPPLTPRANTVQVGPTNSTLIETTIIEILPAPSNDAQTTPVISSAATETLIVPVPAIAPKTIAPSDDKEESYIETKTATATVKASDPSQSEILLNQILDQLNKAKLKQEQRIRDLKEENKLLLAQNQANTRDIASLTAQEDKIKKSYLKSNSARAHIPGAILEKQTINKENATKLKQNKNKISATTVDIEIFTDLIDQLNKLRDELKIYQTDRGFDDDCFCKDLLALQIIMAVFFKDATQAEKQSAQIAMADKINNMSFLHAPVAIRRAILEQQEKDEKQAEDEERNVIPALVEKIQHFQVKLTASIMKGNRILKQYENVLDPNAKSNLTREEFLAKYNLIMLEDIPTSVTNFTIKQALTVLNQQYNSNYAVACKKEKILNQIYDNLGFIIDATDQFPGHKKIRDFSQKALQAIPEEGTLNFHNLAAKWAKQYSELARNTLASIAPNKVVEQPAHSIMIAQPKPLTFGQKIWRNKFSILLALGGAGGGAVLGFLTLGTLTIPLVPFIAAVSGIGIGGSAVSGLLGMGVDALLRPADEIIMKPIAAPESEANRPDEDYNNEEADGEECYSPDELDHKPNIIVRGKSVPPATASTRATVDPRVSQHRQGFHHRPTEEASNAAGRATGQEENKYGRRRRS